MPTRDIRFRTYLKAFFSDMLTRMSGPLSVPFAVAATLGVEPHSENSLRMSRSCPTRRSVAGFCATPPFAHGIRQTLVWFNAARQRVGVQFLGLDEAQRQLLERLIFADLVGGGGGA